SSNRMSVMPYSMAIIDKLLVRLWRDEEIKSLLKFSISILSLRYDNFPRRYCCSGKRKCSGAAKGTVSSVDTGFPCAARLIPSGRRSRANISRGGYLLDSPDHNP